MKTLAGIFILALAITYGGLVSLEFFPRPQWLGGSSSSETDDRSDSEISGETQAPVYPARIQITDLKGRSLDIVLSARSEEHFVFERVEDGRVFTFSLDGLTPESKELIESFPTSDSVVADEAVSKEPSFEETYVAGLRREIEKLEAKAKAVRYEAARTESAATRRSLRNEYKELWKKFVDLKEELDQREEALETAKSDQ